jgi:chromosome segregation ATPase
MKVLLILLLLTILVIVTLPYGLHKQVAELDKKNKSIKIEPFYNASSSGSSSSSCPSDLLTCKNEKMLVENNLISKNTESKNYQENYDKCTKDLGKISGEFTDKIDTILKQVVKQETTLNNRHILLNTAQEALSSCQNKNADTLNETSKLQKQYNDLVGQYQNLQKAYKELADNYHIKCYDYYINSRTSVPAQSDK